MKYYVYFIQSKKSKYIKIGHTDNPEKRLRSLQTGSAESLVLLGTLCFESREQAAQYEQKAHDYLKDSRLEGEWFDFTTEVIEFLIDFEWFTPVIYQLRGVIKHLKQENIKLQQSVATLSYAGA